MKPSPLRPLAALLCLGLGLPIVSLSARATPTFEAVQGFATGPQQPVCRLVRDASGNLYGSTYAGGMGAGTIFKVAPDGTVTTLHVFDQTDGWSAAFGLTFGPDGNLYGVAASSFSSQGNVFRITPDGSFTILHAFSGGADGGWPVTQLLLASDGNFYGTTNEGGAHGFGTIYRITPSGELTTVVSMKQDEVGWVSLGSLIEGVDGNIYGTTTDNRVGGENKGGSIFRLTPSSGTITALATFDALPNMAGAFPHGVIQGSDGNFYGSTQGGGPNGGGTVFKMTPTGTLTLLKGFGWPEAMDLYGSLVEGPDGDLYGTAQFGGPDGEGVFFKISPTGTYTVLSTLDQADGHPYRPQAGFILGEDGYFYGTTTAGGPRNGGTVVRMNAAGEYTVVAGFDVNQDMWLDSALVQASDGSFYGTSLAGGVGFGGIYRMSPDAQISHIASFDTGSNQFFLSQLALGSNGNLYGVQSRGGNYYVGGIYEVTPEGAFSYLWSFDGEYGSDPTGVVQGTDGAFYGTTSQGGLMGGGVAFRLTTSGDFSLIAEFDGTNGFQPKGSMIQASDGNFYGVSTSGGSDMSIDGSIFKLTPSGDLTTFALFGTDPEDAQRPVAGLVQGSDGNFYGASEGGGTDEAGAIYKVAPDGSLTTIASFSHDEGWFPVGALAEGPDGAFYGVTNRGGSEGIGTVFRVTSAGVLTYVHDFQGSAYGRYPAAGLTKGADGDLYGTASDGGSLLDGSPAGGGQIFRIHFGAEVATNGATEVGVLGAKLNGVVNPGGYATTVTFQYGTSPTLESSSTVSGGTLSAGDSPVGVQAVLSGLAPETTYYFRAVAVNGETPVPQAGDVRSFTTAAAVPASVSTQPASSVTFTTASLNADVIAGTYPAGVTFEYGTSPTLASSTTVSGGTIGAGEAIVSVPVLLSGLNPGTTYYFRAITATAENQVQQTGEIRSFTTTAVIPAQGTTQAATDITTTTAKLNGSVSSGTYGATISFQYGTSATLATSTTVSAGSVAAGTTAAVSAPLTGLTAGTTYYFRVVTTQAGSSAPQLGQIASFTTTAAVTGKAKIGVKVAGEELENGESIEFDDTKIGDTDTITLTIRNTSNKVALTGIAVSLTGRDDDQFKIITAPATTVAPGAKTTCVIRFAPTAEGKQKATLLIASNDPNDNPFKVKLSGIAAPRRGGGHGHNDRDDDRGDCR
ncbi:choice-of-anchor D domain-containing protein [Luteolibacter ambystomatis]|uniref:Choice-of-anchor D domain-containing protein n=1 Tax=Luteolibacter ambystomatis TaxID=2824561 RepID=A0A975PFV9_9BACT|nr:choice-of-anchor tandem repeat GloVer-containing protein [Luteolibacter ambystomatis]QUE51821.1 choice-of-anchor D domain-containing protein [Luteolibacter ambystomatis]